MRVLRVEKSYCFRFEHLIEYVAKTKLTLILCDEIRWASMPAWTHCTGARYSRRPFCRTSITSSATRRCWPKRREYATSINSLHICSSTFITYGVTCALTAGKRKRRWCTTWRSSSAPPTRTRAPIRWPGTCGWRATVPCATAICWRRETGIPASLRSPPGRWAQRVRTRHVIATGNNVYTSLWICITYREIWQFFGTIQSRTCGWRKHVHFELCKYRVGGGSSRLI